MNSEQLFEKGVMDDIGSNLRYQGRRFKDSALAAMGSKKAAGRRVVDTIAHERLNDFMAYVGGQGIDPITDDSVRDYIQRYFPDALQAVEPVIQQVVPQQPPQQQQQGQQQQTIGWNSQPYTLTTNPAQQRQQPPPANQQGAQPTNQQQQQQQPPPADQQKGLQRLQQLRTAMNDPATTPADRAAMQSEINQITTTSIHALQNALSDPTLSDGQRKAMQQSIDWFTAQAQGTTPKAQPTPQQVQRHGELQNEIKQGIMNNAPVMDKINKYLRNAKGTNLESYALKFLNDMRSSYGTISIGNDPFGDLDKPEPEHFIYGAKMNAFKGGPDDSPVGQVRRSALGGQGGIEWTSKDGSQFRQWQDGSSGKIRTHIQRPNGTVEKHWFDPVTKGHGMGSSTRGGTASPQATPTATSTAAPQYQTTTTGTSTSPYTLNTASPTPAAPTTPAAPKRRSTRRLPDINIPPVPGTNNSPPTSASAPDELTIPRPPGSPAPAAPQVPDFLQRQGNASTPTSASAPDDLTIPHAPGTEPRATPQVPRFLQQRQYNSNVTPATSMGPRAAMPSMPASLAAQRNGPGEATPVARPVTPAVRPRAFGGNIPTRPFGRKGTTESAKPRLTEDRWWVLAALDNVLRTTQRDTPPRHEVIASLRSMQRDPEVASRIPQLAQIQEANRSKVFDLAVYLVEHEISDKSDLMEAYQRIMQEAVELGRRQLDQIFLALARTLVQSGKATTQLWAPKQQQQAAGGHGQGRVGHSSGRYSSHVDAREIMNTRITPEILKQVEESPRVRPQPSQSDWHILQQAVGQGGTIAQIMQNMRHQSPSPAAMTALLYAAEIAH